MVFHFFGGYPLMCAVLLRRWTAAWPGSLQAWPGQPADPTRAAYRRARSSLIPQPMAQVPRGHPPPQAPTSALAPQVAERVRLYVGGSGGMATDPSLSAERLAGALRGCLAAVSRPDALPEFGQLQVCTPPHARFAFASCMAPARCCTRRQQAAGLPRYVEDPRLCQPRSSPGMQAGSRV